MYNIVAQQYLDYRERHPDESQKDSDIFDQFHLFLTELLGLSVNEAQHEVAIFMNEVCDAMD